MASRRGQLLDGVLLLDKPQGLSSNHALQRAKRALDARKAGHTGTLDPFATGLLVCCLGRATKIAGNMLAADKAYEATLVFGEETDSGDLTGNTVAQADDGFKGVQAEHFEDVLNMFRGEISQIPPMYSALKKDGRPLYKYAREGVEIERAPRQVVIRELETRAFDGRQAMVYVHCSKGTYIRTLAQDIGRALGCGAHLVALRRTCVGPFQLQDAVELSTLQAMPAPQTALILPENLPEGLMPLGTKQKG